MLDLDKHEITKKIPYPDSPGEWYLVKHLPINELSNYDNDFEIFKAHVLDWGGISASGKEFKCTDENKEVFFKKATDRISWLIGSEVDLGVIFKRGYFGLMDAEVYQKRLGEYQAILENGVKSNRSRTSQVADDAKKS